MFISIPQAFPHCKGDFASPSRVYFTPLRPTQKLPAPEPSPPAQGAFFTFARILPGLLVHAVLAVGKAHSVPLHRRIIAGIAIGDIIIRITAPIVTTIDPVFAADFLDYISTILIQVSFFCFSEQIFHRKQCDLPPFLPVPDGSGRHSNCSSDRGEPSALQTWPE